MGSLLQDLRYGLRMLAKSPAVSAVAVFSLALGIGASTTVFSVVDGLYLRPWPVKEPERLVMIKTDRAINREFSMSSYPDYLDIHDAVRAFSDVVAYGDRGGFISGEGRGEEVTVEVVSPNFFAGLGVKPLLGRVFSAQPEQAGSEAHSLVVNYLLWQRYFGGDASLPGKTTLFDGKPFSVIGVAPQGFCGLVRGCGPLIWVTPEGWGQGDHIPRDNRWFGLVGRLRPGVQLAEARSQLNVLAQRLAIASPATNQDAKFLASSASEAAHEGMGSGIYLMAMVGLVLLISCANVAVLLLSQTERRQREIAMRLALGAGRRRLVAQLLTEGLLLSLAGGTLGFLLASWFLKLVLAMLPELSEVHFTLDTRVLLFTAAISLLTALGFGLAPGLRAARCDLVAILKGGDTQGGRIARRLPLRSLLVASEIALSVVLLVGSALLLRSLLYSLRINPGFEPKKNVLMLSVAPPEMYGYTAAQAEALYSSLAARVESVPGVLRASYARRPPLTESERGETKAVAIPGVQPPPGVENFSIRYNVAAPKFFATVGGRLERGREFNAFDLTGKVPVVIINGAMAQRFWPEQDPIGKSIQMDKRDYQIVGVVEAGKYVKLHETPQPYLFVPFTEEYSPECILFVETTGDPGALAPTILKAMAGIDKRLPIVSAVTFRQYMREVMVEERMMASLLATLSLMGMFLAAVGLYAAVAYMVNRRTHEIGIRMALGARRGAVLRLVVTQGLRLSAAGAAVGLAGAFAASRVMARFIYGVAPTDTLSYAAGTIVAICVALLASYFPARRATKVDPMVALRYE